MPVQFGRTQFLSFLCVSGAGNWLSGKPFVQFTLDGITLVLLPLDRLYQIRRSEDLEKKSSRV